jgi:hypothetical protein
MIKMTGYDQVFEVPRSVRYAARHCGLTADAMKRLTGGRVTAWDLLDPVLASVPETVEWRNVILDSVLAAADQPAQMAMGCTECRDTGYLGLADPDDPDTLIDLFRETDDGGYQMLTADGSWRDGAIPSSWLLEVLDVNLARDLAAAVLAGAALVRRFYWPRAFLPPESLLAATPGDATVTPPPAPATNPDGTAPAPDDWAMFAIVDDLDTGAVIEVIRLKPGPELERYEGKGVWVADPKLLTQLQGVKPPPLVELNDPAKLNAVLDQIDQGGGGGGAPATPTAAAGLVADAPLTVSPDPRAEKLRRYWSTGKGAAKIRWGTPGDWKRCYRHLAKFMGERAKGYCQNLHRRTTGVWTGDRRNPGRRGSLTALSASGHVLCVGDRFKMLGADAVTYTAEVVDLEAVRNKTYPGVVGGAVDVLHASVDPDDRVAVAVTCEGADPAASVDNRHGISKPLVYGSARVPEYCLPAEGVTVFLPPSVVRTTHLPSDHWSRTGFNRAHGQEVSQEESLVAAIQSGLWAGVDMKGRTLTMAGLAGLKDGLYEELVNDQFSGIIRGLTAGAFPVAPPETWFRNPGLKELTPTQVEDTGQVWGHLASFDMPHIGLPGNKRAPRSRTDYAYFRTGAIKTDTGRKVPVGQLTLVGGHASMYADAGKAVAHYDNTQSAVADVAVGEDKYGIWFAGSLRPDASPEQVRAFMASSLSGDWRPINGHLEMVACCAVNVPGFPIARSMVAGGVVTALVAAGAREIAIKRASLTADAAIQERVAALETAMTELIPADPALEPDGIEIDTEPKPESPAEDIAAKIARIRQENADRRRQELRDRVHGVAAAGAVPPQFAKKTAVAGKPGAAPTAVAKKVAVKPAAAPGKAPVKDVNDLTTQIAAAQDDATKAFLTSEAARLGHPELIPADWTKKPAAAPAAPAVPVAAAAGGRPKA